MSMAKSLPVKTIEVGSHLAAHASRCHSSWRLSDECLAPMHCGRASHSHTPATRRCGQTERTSTPVQRPKTANIPRRFGLGPGHLRVGQCRQPKGLKNDRRAATRLDACHLPLVGLQAKPIARPVADKRTRDEAGGPQHGAGSRPARAGASHRRADGRSRCPC